MKLFQIVHDADHPEHTGALEYYGPATARIASVTGGGYWLVPIDRIRQGNGRGLSKRRQVQRKQAAARKYQPMSARARKELRALVEKEQYDKFPANWLRDRCLRLLDDIDHLNAKLKEANR